MKAVWVFLLAAAAAACSLEPEPLAPFGEALVFVDTDVPVPKVASRLRIDLHSEDGAAAPFATRDDVRPDPRDWPTSFSIFTDDTTRGRTVLVRLRAYPEGRVSANGTDPDPTIAIDRLVRVRLEPGRRGRVRVTLRGACAGIAADVSTDSASTSSWRSCIDDRHAPPILEDARIEETLARDVPSEVGTYGRSSCDGIVPGADRVCVPGGAFILGERFYRPSNSTVLDARPERVIRISRLVIDRDEVSVARYRDALARGFVPPLAVEPLERDGPPGSTVDDACTFSANPRGREQYALSCVPWVTADAFCRFDKGALPTEAQWEYIALAAERPRKVVYPWGDDPPSCDRAIYARSVFSAECSTAKGGEGPQIVNAAAGDVTPLGVRDLGGSLEEHVADSAAGFGEPCWSAAADTDPICTRPVPKECEKDPASLECRTIGDFVHVTRGGGWTTFPSQMRGITRGSAQASSTSELIGFRCVYPAAVAAP